MMNPLITTVDDETGETVTREMTDAEYETYLVVTAEQVEHPA